MHYRADGTSFPSASGLSFHLHNGRTTNAFCINSGDLMVANGERDGTIQKGEWGASLHSHDICSQFN